MSKYETAPDVTFLDPSDTFSGGVDSYFWVKIVIYKKKVTHSLLSFGLLLVWLAELLRGRGNSHTSTPVWARWVCLWWTYNVIGIIDRYCYNFVNLKKRKGMFWPICIFKCIYKIPQQSIELTSRPHFIIKFFFFYFLAAALKSSSLIWK